MDRLDECVSCGERLQRRENLTNVPFDVQDQMQVRCKVCAMEVLGMTVFALGIFSTIQAVGGVLFVVQKAFPRE